MTLPTSPETHGGLNIDVTVNSIYWNSNSFIDGRLSNNEMKKTAQS